MTVLFDSGIRRGADVVKALALGADAVLLGRPYVWGLALDGATGVETVLRMLLAELDLTLALCGYARPAEVSRDALAPTPGGASPGRDGESGPPERPRRVVGGGSLVPEPGRYWPGPRRCASP